MIEKDYLLRLRIEALRVLARTDEPNRAVLIERNIEDYLKTSGSERASLGYVREADTFAIRLERAIARSNGARMPKLIEARAEPTD